MWKSVLKYIGIGSALTLLAIPAFAATDDEKSEIGSLKERLERLEMHEEAKEEGLFQIFRDNKTLTFWGAVEVEANYSKQEGGEESSDIVLATALLGTDIRLTEQVGGHLVFLYEEDETPLDIDEGNISVRFNDNLGMTVGKMYLPFGEFNSNLISDPYTINLGETNKTAMVGALSMAIFELKLGIFNGDTDTLEDTDNIDSIIVALEIEAKKDISFGISYINDISETSGNLVDNTPGNKDYFNSNVAGIGGFISLGMGPVIFDAEIISALDDYEDAQAELTADDELTGNRPMAYNLELVYTIINDLDLALRYEGTNDFKDDLIRYGLGVSYGIFENTVLSLEYLIEDPAAEDSDNTHTITSQLAFEF